MVTGAICRVNERRIRIWCARCLPFCFVKVCKRSKVYTGATLEMPLLKPLTRLERWLLIVHGCGWSFEFVKPLLELGVHMQKAFGCNVNCVAGG